MTDLMGCAPWMRAFNSSATMKENSFQGEYSLEVFALVTPSTNWKNIYRTFIIPSTSHSYTLHDSMRLVLFLSSFDRGESWTMRREETWSNHTAGGQWSCWDRLAVGHSSELIRKMYQFSTLSWIFAQNPVTNVKTTPSSLLEDEKPHRIQLSHYTHRHPRLASSSPTPSRSQMYEEV